MSTGTHAPLPLSLLSCAPCAPLASRLGHRWVGVEYEHQRLAQCMSSTHARALLERMLVALHRVLFLSSCATNSTQQQVSVADLVPALLDGSGARRVLPVWLELLLMVDDAHVERHSAAARVALERVTSLAHRTSHLALIDCARAIRMRVEQRMITVCTASTLHEMLERLEHEPTLEMVLLCRRIARPVRDVLRAATTATATTPKSSVDASTSPMSAHTRLRVLSMPSSPIGSPFGKSSKKRSPASRHGTATADASLMQQQQQQRKSDSSPELGVHKPVSPRRQLGRTHGIPGGAARLLDVTNTVVVSKRANDTACSASGSEQALA